jgi:hypothetical protein
MTTSPAVSDLLNSAKQLQNTDFEDFVSSLLALRATRIAPVLSSEETMLLEKIYEKLPSTLLNRYQYLTELRKKNDISENEYEELLELVKQTESYNVERLQHIVKLAALRQVTVQTLMTQLGLMPLHG